MKKFILAATAAIMMSSSALAGPFIIDGTDADDHGFASSGANQDGWFYIQRALENIAAGSSLTRSQKTIAVLGSNAGSTAGNAAQSAVALSSTLSAAGWTVVLLNDADITGFFNNTGSSLQSTGASIIYMDSGGNVGGGISGAEQTLIDSFATQIDTFVGSGGGLFSMAQGYGWLSSLIPGLTTTNSQATGITLTAAGTAAFPGLTNADLNAGPHHKYFENVGILPVLGTRTSGGQAVILGGAGGSITVPTPGAVPESSTWIMMLAGFGLAGSAMRYRRRKILVSFG